jgi:hypothetical protein
MQAFLGYCDEQKADEWSVFRFLQNLADHNRPHPPDRELTDSRLLHQGTGASE